MDYSQSRNYYDRAAIIPGRSMTRSKAPGRLYEIGAGPLYASSASGCRIIDVDNHKYIDLICALGAISLGYGALDARVCQRGVYSLPSVSEIRAAEAMLRDVAPWASHVRFTKTGSEATHAAYRIAKRATGRELVLIGNWSYHGWHEWCEKKLNGDPESDWVIPYPHGHRGGMLDGSLHARAEDVAAVIVEPHRWEPVSFEWLQYVRDWCSSVGALLVFDEMIYGGRAALGGVTELFGVTPDLACFGKALGNGAPIACVVGREALRDHGELVSGTYSGDAYALDMLVETISFYTHNPVIETLHARGRQLRVGVEAAICETGWTDRAWFEGTLAAHKRLRFADALLGKVFAAKMVARGVLWHPDVVNIMFAHGPADIEQAVSAAYESLAEVTS